MLFRYGGLSWLQVRLALRPRQPDARRAGSNRYPPGQMATVCTQVTAVIFMIASPVSPGKRHRAASGIRCLKVLAGSGKIYLAQWNRAEWRGPMACDGHVGHS